MDGPRFQEYTRRVMGPFMTDNGITHGVMFMDNLGTQVSEEGRAAIEKVGLIPWFFPPGTTDILQPIDHHCAVMIKKPMAQLLMDKLASDDAFRDSWLGLSDGTYPAWKCRVLMTLLWGMHGNGFVRERTSCN